MPERMKPWLFRIAHNVAIDLVVRRREFPSDELPESPSVDREPFTGTLVEALATLPDRQRRVYVLREVHGLRIDETAAELELTASQVEQALFAARNRLAEQLVFGDRLNCVTVQRLAAGPLDTSERRALKTHLRTCTACRQTLGLRGRALSVFPAGMSLDWLPKLGAGLLTGGAPAAAKVGAVVATATIAAGVPVVAIEHTTRSHAHRPTVPQAVPATPVAAIRTLPRVNVEAVEHVAVPAVHTRTVARHEQRHKSAEHARRHRGRDHGEDAARRRIRSAETEHRHGDSGRDRSGEDGSTIAVGSSGRDSGSGDHGGTTRTSGSGDRHSGGGGGGGETATSRDPGGDRHGGRTTSTTPVVKTTSDSNGGEAPTGEQQSGDSGGGGGGGGGSDSGGSGSGCGGGSGGDGGGSGGGGGDDQTVTLPTPTLPTPELPIPDPTHH